MASDLGISPDLLYHWKHEYQKHQQSAFPGSGKLKDAQEEKSVSWNANSNWLKRSGPE